MRSETIGVRAVGKGARRVLVDLHEDAVDSRRDARGPQGVDEVGLAPGAVAEAARALHAVGDVEDHRDSRRSAGSERSACRRRGCCSRSVKPRSVTMSVRIAGGGRLLDDALHVPGGHELALLDVDDLPVRAASRTRSVWRQRNAGICSTSATCGGLLDLGDLVHVGEDRDAERSPSPRPGSRGRAPCPGRGRSRALERLALS